MTQNPPERISGEYERCPICQQIMIDGSCLDCPYSVYVIDALPELADLERIYTLAQQLSFSDHELTADVAQQLMEFADKRMSAIEKRIGWDE